LLTAFPFSEIERVVRRTAILAVAIGVVGSIVAVLIGQPYFVPGIGLGLVLAMANHRVFQSSTLRYTTPEGSVQRKPFAGSVALRLGVCTLVAIGLLVVDQPVGWGVIAGLAVFQAAMLGNAVVALLRYQRQGFVEEGSGDA
jgi:drug/metabolite transporter (DMT)-like permease